MTMWGFMLGHFGHILGFNSASKSIPELDIHHGGPMEALWGRQVSTRGPPKVKEPGHLVVGMVVLGVPRCPLDNP